METRAALSGVNTLVSDQFVTSDGDDYLRMSILQNRGSSMSGSLVGRKPGFGHLPLHLEAKLIRIPIRPGLHIYKARIMDGVPWRSLG